MEERQSPEQPQFSSVLQHCTGLCSIHPGDFSGSFFVLIPIFIIKTKSGKTPAMQCKNLSSNPQKLCKAEYHSAFCNPSTSIAKWGLRDKRISESLRPAGVCSKKPALSPRLGSNSLVLVQAIPLPSQVPSWDYKGTPPCLA